MKYRKKPIVIEAFKLGTDDLPSWYNKALIARTIVIDVRDCDGVFIKTLEGTMKARAGDYIIQGTAFEIYPCKSDVFEKSYEKVEE